MTDYLKVISDNEEKYGLKPGVLKRLIEVESGGNLNARSPAGAIGLTQLMPKTAQDLGVDPHDPLQNIEGGAKYLAHGVKKFNGDYAQAIAGYNAGHNNKAVVAKDWNNLPAETKNYANKFLDFIIPSAKAEEAPNMDALPSFAEMSDTPTGGNNQTANELPSNELPANELPSFDQMSDTPDVPKETARPIGDTLLSGVKNFPKDTAKLAGELGSMVWNGDETIKGVAQLASGAVQAALPDDVKGFIYKAFPGAKINEDVARAVGQHYADTYGSIEGFKKAVAESPAHVAADLYAVISGGLGVASRVAPKLARALAPEDASIVGARARLKAYEGIAKAANDIGVKVTDINPAQIQQLIQTLIDSSKAGKDLDPAALLRKSDFEKLGMEGMTGQITREPLQYSRELNSRAAVPEISQKLADEAEQLRSHMNNLAGESLDMHKGGKTLISAVKAIDNKIRANISRLYGEAKASTGKDLELPINDLHEALKTIKTDFPDSIPSGIISRLEQYGIDSGTPTSKALTIEEVDYLEKFLQNNKDSSRRTNLALSRIKTALRDTVKNAAGDAGPFAPAVKEAAQRFSLQNAIPALKKVADGKAKPDSFVRNFIINADTDEVTGLAKLLNEYDPAAYAQAKGQLGAALKKAALGNNAAGDASFMQERFATALNNIGDTKLSAFYSPEQIDKLHTLSRVSAYIQKSPAAGVVNASNTFTAAAAMNKQLMSALSGGLTDKIPLIGPAAKAGSELIKRNAIAKEALMGTVPSTQTPLSASQRALLPKYSIKGGSAGLLSINNASKDKKEQK